MLTETGTNPNFSITLAPTTRFQVGVYTVTVRQYSSFQDKLSSILYEITCIPNVITMNEHPLFSLDNSEGTPRIDWYLFLDPPIHI